ncbi:MAG: DUF2330 domain-containing protein [Candidatus Limnocylindria bacterium]
MRRLFSIIIAATAALLITAGPALACGGLIGPNGAVNLLRTTTFAGYYDGVEHYVTSFEFAGGGGGAFGSLVPLPDVPTNVEKGGDWTLQRLVLETEPVRTLAFAAAQADGAERAEILIETRIDALDITVLRGGGAEVGAWATENGFRLPPDAPEVLDFYADRSPIFMAAVFDADAARERGQQVGDGTPVHLTIPTDDPWVPLRILGLGKGAAERVEADVYLLTDEEPRLLPGPEAEGLFLDHSAAATDLLLADLRSDTGMEWVPEEAWLTKLRIDAAAGDLAFDLAIDPTGTGTPSVVDAGFAPFGPAEAPPILPDLTPLFVMLVAIFGFTVATGLYVVTGGRGSPPLAGA